jgi:hypothetical protein
LARKRMDKAFTGTRKSAREGSQRLPASSIHCGEHLALT